MGEKNMNPAELGSKLYFCRAEDLEKNPNTLMQEIDLKTYVGDISMKAEPKACNNAEHWTVTHGSSITGNATLIGTVTEMDSWLKPQNITNARLVFVADCRQLPRKLKKGFRATYQRNTKWTRKASLWKEHNQKELTGHLRINGEELIFNAE